MNRAAIIVAAAAEERRSIAQLIKSCQLFPQVHFCSNAEEASFLLKNTQVELLCSDACPSGKESVRLTAGLSKLAADYNCQLVFFSQLDPEDLAMLGILPKNCHCLGYDSSSLTIATLLKRLIQRNTSEGTEAATEHSRLLDQNAGVYNRFYFEAFLDQELSRSKLTGRPFSLLLIEPSGNETAGQANTWGGLLPSIASTIKTQIRTSDLLCRIEARRLALLLPETTGMNAERVRQRIQSNAQDLAKEFPFDLKIGLASPSTSSQYTRHGLLRQAEAAL